jgi:hypothetical protein
MPDVDQYAPGTPSWVDVSSPDTDAAAAFYGALFGWEAGEPGTMEETGGYRLLSMRGRSVAGLGPTRDGGPPPMWTTYVSVVDADATCAAAAAAGGTVHMEPMDVMEAGRMAVIGDPQGAVFAVWQPQKTAGAQIVNEPGSLVWSELAVRDTGPEPAFYAAVFGWVADTAPMGGTEYTTWRLGDHPVGGMIQMDEQWPAEMPPHWMTYFAVADVDATCAQATGLGATVHVPPTDIEGVGRFALIGDPHGAVFSVITMATA